jgi:predicted  nucleic acid-binding Zn-ribbon protein
MGVKKTAKPFACMECGKRLTLKGAERAMSVGCPGCGGSDIDLAPSAKASDANVGPFVPMSGKE